MTFLVACQGAGDPTGEVRTGYDATAETECRAEGGDYRVAGALGQHVCFTPTPDAGQRCRAESDCSGLCLADTKTCAPVTPMFGCHAILMEDGARAEICID